MNLDPIKDELRETGQYFFQRGWSVGTSSNYSVVLQRDPLQLLVTASGKDKGRLSRDDFVVIGDDGKPTHPDQPKSSAETHLHLVAAQQPDVGAVLHTHSIWSTLLSDLYFEEGGFEIEGYEMLKGLEGIRTHETSLWVPIFENTQDIPALATLVSQQLPAACDAGDAAADPGRSVVPAGNSPLRFGYLIRRHGLYTWGRNLLEARRHIEIFEFLFECVARRLQLTGSVNRQTVGIR